MSSRSTDKERPWVSSKDYAASTPPLATSTSSATTSPTRAPSASRARRRSSPTSSPTRIGGSGGTRRRHRRRGRRDPGQQFTQGNITTTNNPLDMAINGNGFFRLDTNGTITYLAQRPVPARQGRLHRQCRPARSSPATRSTPRVRSCRRIPARCRSSNADFPPIATSKSEMVLNLDSREAPITAGLQHQRLDDLQQVVVDDRLRQPRQPALDRHLFRQDRRPAPGRVYGAADGTPFAAPLGTLTSRATARWTPRRRRCRSTCRWRSPTPRRRRSTSPSTSPAPRSSAAASASTR